MKNTIENAVSPVVGVMLMLVVTIIIAAIVSAFAGGAVSGVSKVPQGVDHRKIQCIERSGNRSFGW